MAKKKTQTPAPYQKVAVPQIAQPLKPQESGFLNIPTSPATHLIMEVLGAGAAIADLPDRKKQVSHGTSYSVAERGRSRKITMKSAKGEVTIELSDIDRVTGSNKPAKKLLLLSLSKANEQALHEGQLTRDYVSFPLQELIDKGMYTAPQSARKGFNAGASALTSLKVRGKVRVTKKRETAVDALEVLFTGARIEQGQCKIFLNPRINWSFIAQYFTILPSYYFRLSNRASDLFFYIFYLARQHTGAKDIQKVKNEVTGREEQAVVFNISFRAIQHRLQLPSEVGNTRPKQTIKDPIDEAIAEIEEEHKKTYNNTELRLLPVCDDEAPIADYLDNGYLRVTLIGDFAQTFIQISQDTTKQIEEAEKRQARIMEKAVAMKTAAALEEQEKAEGSGNNA